MPTAKVALLGLGIMGAGMARNLLQAGVSLNVYNRTYARAEAMQSKGAAAMRTPAEAAAGADFVLSMLADDDASRAVWLGEQGALAAMKPGSVAVECGTVSPGWVAELARAAEARDVSLMDAPVTGSRPQAEAGQLTFLVGAQSDVLQRVAPVLQTMSKEILHAGPVGSGAELKLINNYLCGVQIASFAEALAWIERSRLDTTLAVSFLRRAAPGSPLLGAMAERMMQPTEEVFFLLRLMAKDLRYARTTAAVLDVPLRTGSASESLFAEAEAQGMGGQDMSHVIGMFRAAKQPDGM